LLTKQRSDLGVILGTPKEFSPRQLCMAVLWRQIETVFSTSVMDVMASFMSIMAAHQKSFLRVRYAGDKAREQSALGQRHNIAQFFGIVLTIHVTVPFFNCPAPRAWAGVIKQVVRELLSITDRLFVSSTK